MSDGTKIDYPGSPCWHCGSSVHDTAGHAHTAPIMDGQPTTMPKRAEVYICTCDGDDCKICYPSNEREYREELARRLEKKTAPTPTMPTKDGAEAAREWHEQYVQRLGRSTLSFGDMVTMSLSYSQAIVQTCATLTTRISELEKGLKLCKTELERVPAQGYRGWREAHDTASRLLEGRQ